MGLTKQQIGRFFSDTLKAAQKERKALKATLERIKAAKYIQDERDLTLDTGRKELREEEEALWEACGQLDLTVMVYKERREQIESELDKLGK